jgi:hypothetical protein
MSASPMSDVSIYAKNITLSDGEDGYDLRCEGDVVVMTTHGLIRGSGLVYEGDEFRIESAKITNPDTKITAGEISFPFDVGGINVHALPVKPKAENQPARGEVANPPQQVIDAGQTPPVTEAAQQFAEQLPAFEEPVRPAEAVADGEPQLEEGSFPAAENEEVFSF